MITDYSWLEEELSSRGYSALVPEQAKILNAIRELFYTLDAQELDSTNLRTTTVELFYNLQLAPDVRIRDTVTEDGTWKQFYLGSVRVGATVRVKKDAYTSTPGREHNGLVGYLVAGRGGRAVVRYIGRNDGIGHYHNPQMLEVLDKN